MWARPTDHHARYEGTGEGSGGAIAGDGPGAERVRSQTAAPPWPMGVRTAVLDHDQHHGNAVDAAARTSPAVSKGDDWGHQLTPPLRVLRTGLLECLCARPMAMSTVSSHFGSPATCGRRPGTLLAAIADRSPFGLDAPMADRLNSSSPAGNPDTLSAGNP